MEEKIGRYLKPSEVVHHISENKLDNRLENLVILNRQEHARHHNTGKKASQKTIIVLRGIASKRKRNKLGYFI